MKKVVAGLCVVVLIFRVDAETLVFKTSESSTGNALDDLAESGAQVAVPEISELTLTATFGANGGTVNYLNATTTQLGIDSDLTSEGSSYFDTGEWLGFAFDKNINVSRLKFANFTEGDSIQLSWDTTVLTLGDNDLNHLNEYAVDWDVSATDVIRLEASGKSGPDSTLGGFGLEEMDVTVIPEPATLSLMGLIGLIAWIIRRASRA